MSLYEYSNSVSDFQNLISSVPENTADMKDKMKGELFLSLEYLPVTWLQMPMLELL